MGGGLAAVVHPNTQCAAFWLYHRWPMTVSTGAPQHHVKLARTACRHLPVLRAGEVGEAARPTGHEAVERGMLENFLDGEATALIYALRSRELAKEEPAHVQVVEIGGGGSARPHNLPLDSDVRYFDMDLPPHICSKCQRLEEAEAAGVASGSAAKWLPVASHYRKADFVDTLKEHGWDPSVPTVWVTGLLLRDADARTAEAIMQSISGGARQTPCSALLGVFRNSCSVKDFLLGHGWRAMDTLKAPGGDSYVAMIAWQRCE